MSRARSPPERFLIGVRACSGWNRNSLHVAGHVALLTVDEQVLAASVRQIVGERFVWIEVFAFLVQRRDFEIGPELYRAAIRVQAGQSASFRSVVLPAPFGPTRPMQSPRCTRIEKGATMVRSPKVFVILSASMTSLPDSCASGNCCLNGALRALVAAILCAHGLQLAEAAHVTLAPGGDAVA